ncbi:MAG: transcriptional regulator [Euzebyales bacterium]|jgi:DNA-binding MarR family transcriptional regulator|nr:transcriptional regulator [Euzebyales bacterium]
MSDHHPASGLDDAVHQRVRLGVLAILAEVRDADFAYLRDALQVTDGNLSRHLQTLEQSGHVAVRKGFEGRRPRTWIAATDAGRQALETELGALRTLIDRVDRAGAGG